MKTIIIHMAPRKKLIRQLSEDELSRLIKKENNARILQRLLFIKQLHIKDNIPDACKHIDVCESAGYEWLKRWNEQGYKGLIPHFGGGRKPGLDDEQKKELKKLLEQKDNWLTSEIRELIRKTFNVSYSERHVARLLRGMKLHYAKPYPNDYRRPPDAEEILLQGIHEALNEVGNHPTLIGFLDEASPQTTDNKQRFWSVKKPRIIKNTTKYRANTFGFYPLNGREVVDFKENSKAPSVCEFLRSVRDKNLNKIIIMILDNARSHIAKATRKFAKSIGIILVFLPPYSPDLNPIEQIWRCVRRRLSQIFAKSEWAFQETIRTTFHRMAKKTSFMTSWIEKFVPDVFEKL